MKELASGDRDSYKNHLRMSVEKFEELLVMVGPKIQKESTWFREAISARMKLEITLRYLASGDSLSSLRSKEHNISFSAGGVVWRSTSHSSHS
jgi:hypothetical protein